MSHSPGEPSRAKYVDPEYQRIHTNLFSNSIIKPIQHVLPPGVSQANFDLAIAGWAGAVGRENVYGQDEVHEYIDPYELNEDDEMRKVPSGAVWSECLLEPGIEQPADDPD